LAIGQHLPAAMWNDQNFRDLIHDQSILTMSRYEKLRYCLI